MSRVQLFAQCSPLFCIPLYGHLHWARTPLPSLDSSTQTILSSTQIGLLVLCHSSTFQIILEKRCFPLGQPHAFEKTCHSFLY